MIRVLVYSPSFRMRALIIGMVTCQGVEVESVTSRQALFKRCREKIFDRIVIEDYRLFMDGGGNVALLRTHFSNRPRIFVLAPSVDQPTVLSLLDCGVDEYLLLPISAERLRRKICHK